MKNVCYGTLANLDALNRSELEKYALTLEKMGINCLLVPDGGSREPFTTTTQILAVTEKLKAGTGIASVYGRDPYMSSSAATNLNEYSNGRFRLGIGPTHPQFAEQRGHSWTAPEIKMRSYLKDVNSVLDDLSNVDSRPQVFIAANGPKLLELAAELTDGVYTNQMSVAHTAQARNVLGSDKIICPILHLCMHDITQQALAIARPAFVLYASLPAYHRVWKTLGFTDQDFENGGSDALLNETGAYGDVKHIAKRVEEHLTAGASEVILFPVCHQHISFGGPLAGLETLQILINKLSI